MCCFCLFFYRISGILVIELIGLAVTVRSIMGNQSFDYSFFRLCLRTKMRAVFVSDYRLRLGGNRKGFF